MIPAICALFKGTGKAYILDRKEYSGSILENIEDTLLTLISSGINTSFLERRYLQPPHRHRADYLSIVHEAPGGISDIQDIYHTKREAYDHFLPKDKHPFNTINFHNLSPACHKCNSSYKLSADPLHFHSKNPLVSGAGQNRKAFYPYATRAYTIELTITLNDLDWTNITPADIELDTGPAAIRDEIDTWLDIYGIEERYKAKCCAEHDGKDWIREIVDESGNYNQTPQQYLEGKLKTATNQPWADTNFLKRPFLEACKGRGCLIEYG